VCVDESGVNTCLVREYGRSVRGKKVEGVRGGRKFRRVNVIGALCDGKRNAAATRPIQRSLSVGSANALSKLYQKAMR